MEETAGASLPRLMRPTGMVWKRQVRAEQFGQVVLFAMIFASVELCGAQNAPTREPACGGVETGKTGGAKAVQPCPAAATRPPSVSEQFPFPGEPQVASPAKPTADPSSQERFPYPGDSAPQPAKPAGSASDRFPYPGETAGGESSSSRSSGAEVPDPDADAKPKLKDEGSEGDVQPHRKRLRPQAQKTLSDAERAEEDVSVAHFYLQSGNVMGSYLRAKDAVKLQPDASDTHLALAQAAERMGKREEAIAEYKAVLTADPEETEARTARKALERLKP